MCIYVVAPRGQADAVGVLVSRVGPVRALLPQAARPVLAAAAPGVVVVTQCVRRRVLTDPALLACHRWVVLGAVPAHLAPWLATYGVVVLELPDRDEIIEAVEQAALRVAGPPLVGK
jgi:hypothetical protein